MVLRSAHLEPVGKIDTQLGAPGPGAALEKRRGISSQVGYLSIGQKKESWSSLFGRRTGVNNLGT